MSKSIDQRVVDMQFNNQQFESGIKESLGSLDRLKKGLNLEGASKGLNTLNDAGRKFSLAGIAEGVDAIASKFTSLGIIGITAIQNIVNSAMNAGAQLVKSLTIAPIADGMADYNRKLTSVQTIMNATGSDIKTVEGYFSQLDTYADKTIYNLDDMTSAFAKFTNAGVDMDKSVPAIKGIANMVALAGQDAGAARIAMYNLSQSIAGGFLTTMDYKSLNLANVATKEWKNQMIQGAIAAGTLRDAGNGMYETFQGTYSEAALFTEALTTDQWATTDVMLKVLGDYGNEMTDIGKKAQSAAQDVKSFPMMMETLKAAVGTGWTGTFEILIGNLTESKELFTSMTNAIGGFLDKSASARNNMLQEWKDQGGRTALIQAFKTALEGIGLIVKPISDAFREMFPPMTGKRLAELTEALLAFTKRIKIGDDTAYRLFQTFSGLFAILSIGKQAISAIITGIGKLIKVLVPGKTNILGFTAGIGDWLVALDSVIKKGDIFNKAIGRVVDVVDWVAVRVRIGITTIIDFFKSFGDMDLSGVESFSDRVKIRLEPFSIMFGSIGKFFSKMVDGLKKTAPLFYKMASVIGAAFSTLTDNIMGAIGSGDFSKVLDIINTGFLGALVLGIRKFMGSMSKVSGGFTGILDGVKGSLEAWQSSLKAGILLKIAIAIGILAVSLAILAAIDSEKLTGALVAITTLFAELVGTMTIFSKTMSGKGTSGVVKMAAGMIGISIAVLILATAMSKLAKLNWEQIEKGTISIGALMTMLVMATKALSNTKSMIKGALGLILFAFAIKILASAVEKLGAIDIVSLSKGLLAVGVLMTELALFMKITDLSGMGVNKGIGILLLAVALNVLAIAVEKLGKIDLVSLAKGLGAIGVLLTELTIFIRTMPDSKKVISTAVGLVIIGAAMLIFASAIEKMGKMPIDQIGRGLLTMGSALGMLVLSLKFMPKGMEMISIGLGMIGIATALLIISNALKNMGGMTWDEIIRGLVALAGSLTIITIALQFMKTALPGAAALLVVSAALAILANVLKTLGGMSLSEIGKGLLALVGIFVVIGASSLLLAPLIPVILALSGAIFLLGIGLLSIGAGILLFSMGLTALAVSGTAGAAALVAIVTAIIGLIPYLLEQIGIGIILFAKVIQEGMPAIVEAIKALFAGIIQILKELTPPLILTVLNFIRELLDKLLEYVPGFIDTGMKLIIGFLKGIADNMAEVVKTAIDIMLNFLDGIKQKIPDVIDMAFKLIISFIDGLASAIRNNDEAIIDAVENLIDAIIDAIKSFLWRLPEIGGNIIQGLIDGILGMGKALIDAAKGVIKGAINGVKNLLDINSPSGVFEEIGKNTGKGMVVGLEKMSDKVAKASENLGESAVDSMTGTLGRISDLIDGDYDLQPTIRPVIDMTNVEKGLNNTFGRRQGLNITTSADRASFVAAQRQNGRDLSGISQTTNNSDDRRIQIINNYTVRNDTDIRKISQDLKDTLNRYTYAKGVPVNA